MKYIRKVELPYITVEGRGINLAKNALAVYIKEIHVLLIYYVMSNNLITSYKAIIYLLKRFLRCKARGKYRNSISSIFETLLVCFLNSSMISSSTLIFPRMRQVKEFQGEMYAITTTLFFEQFPDKRRYIDLPKHLEGGVIFCCFSTVCFQCG